MVPDAVRTAIWKDVSLKEGANEIEVSAGGFTERAKWSLKKPVDPRLDPPPRPKPEEWVFLQELSKPEEEPAPAPTCPHCLEEIKEGATKGPHCGGSIK